MAKFNADNADKRQHRADIARERRLVEAKRVVARQQAAEAQAAKAAQVKQAVERKQAPAAQGAMSTKVTSTSFEATAYTAFCNTGCIGITATGLNVAKTVFAPSGRRIVAVDPAVVPLGSVVVVTLANGTVIEAEAQDTGGNIKGRRIDILVSTHAEAIQFGRQKINVFVPN